MGREGGRGSRGGARVAERYRRGCFPVICTIGGWHGGAERERVDQIKASKAASFHRGRKGGRGKKTKTRDYMRQPSQGRSYYAIILHPLLNLAL